MYHIRSDGKKYGISYFCCATKPAVSHSSRSGALAIDCPPQLGTNKKRDASSAHHSHSLCSLNGPLIRICQWTPVCFVAIILSWSYYAYVFQFCCFTLPHLTVSESSMLPPISITYLIIFNLLFAMLVWSYLSVAYNRTGYLSAKIISRYRLGPCELADLEEARDENDIGDVLCRFVSHLPHKLNLTTVEGGARYCDVCKLIKPDRAHHCAACRCCVLKMDHHCPWVNNCIQYGNYKQFILFLLYGVLLCIFSAATTLPYFISFWSTTTSRFYTFSDGRSQDLVLDSSNLHIPGHTPNNYLATTTLYRWPVEQYGDNGSVTQALFSTRFHVLFLFFVAIMFGISMSALLSYHCYLVSHNRTTLESFRAPIFIAIGNRPDKNGFDVGGYKSNFEQVFGAQPIYWPLPVFSALGDGAYYPTRHDCTDVNIDHKSLDSNNQCGELGRMSFTDHGITDASNSHVSRSGFTWNAWQTSNASENKNLSTEDAQSSAPFDKFKETENALIIEEEVTTETSSRTNLITNLAPPAAKFVEIPMPGQTNETLPIRQPRHPLTISPYGSFSTSYQAPMNIELFTPS